MAVPPIVGKHSKARTPRRFARQRIETLAYVDLGYENGGFPIDISEGGVAFQGILPLKKDETLCVTFKLPGMDGSITATARIAWLNNSQKGGALQFIDLPQDSRLVLENWLSTRRQAGNPKENGTAIATGVQIKRLPPAPAASLRAGPSKSPAKADPVVVPPSPMPVLSVNDVTKSAKSKATPRLQPYVPGGNAKKRFRIAALAVGLGISMIVAGINLWQYRVILFPHRVSDRPAQPAVPATPVPEAPLPLAIPTAVELSSDLPSVAATPGTDEQAIRTPTAPPDAARSVPSRPVATARARAPQIKPGKLSNFRVPPAQDTRSPGNSTTAVPSGQPITASTNPISGSSNELPAETSAVKISSSAVTPSQEAASVAGSIEIKSDPHPSVRMTPELEWRASWPGINPTYGHLISSVEPQYPKDALRQRIAGAVRLHVVIGRSGSVEKVEPTDGPALLAEAARRAVQQWHFEPTLVAGQPIETEENITIVFRVTNPNATVN